MRMDTRIAAGVAVGALAAASFAVAAGPDLRVAQAARSQDTAAVRTLLAAGAPVNTSPAGGVTALHWAVQRDDAELVELLIGAGADVNAADQYSVTSARPRLHERQRAAADAPSRGRCGPARRADNRRDAADDVRAERGRSRR